MENTTESRETFAASNPTPQGQDGSSLNAAFDVDAFVHASGDGFGNTAPLRLIPALSTWMPSLRSRTSRKVPESWTRKEKKHAKREMKRREKGSQEGREGSEKDLQLHQVPVKGQGQGAVR